VREGRDGPEDLLRAADEEELMSQEVAAAYRRARRILLDALGPAAIARVHRPVPALDWLAVVGLPALFLADAVALATWPAGIAWLAVLVLQGFVIQMFGYAVHDLFVHRQVGGAAGYYVGAFLELFITFRRTRYALYHLDHHALMNTEHDTEAYKQDLDTRWKRLVFLTLPGALLARARTLRAPSAAPPGAASARQRPLDPLSRRRLGFERRLTGVVLGGAGLVTAWWWQLVVFGYLIPLALVTPVASALRMILEHAEADPDNVFHCAVFYRTGAITGPLFFWDAGDCHIVHHIYPAIPFYRIPEALRLMNPVLLAHGARERSLWELLRGWFWRNEPHRSVWSS
jgi:fatty acid desaturase